MPELSRFLQAVELLRSRVDREMPSQHIALLLTVAENPGITMPGLVRTLGMPQGTVSRNVKTLSQYVEWDGGVARLRGRNLLRTEPALGGAKLLAVYLTNSGAALMRELAATINPLLAPGTDPALECVPESAAAGLVAVGA